MKTEYYGAVLLGAVVVMSFLVLFYMIFDAEATPPKPIVEVVGTYKDCEIIQYTNENLARYSYMLYCPIER
jgi:hypothetical protein